jgi:hypothetical protein
MRTGHWLIIAVLLGLLGATVWYLVKVWALSWRSRLDSD